MKKFTVFSFLLAVLSLSALELPLQSGCPRLIDGMLDDVCWTKALKTGIFKPIKPDAPLPAEKTEAFLLGDNENLYIGVRCFYSDKKKRENAKKVWDIDTVEIFIDPGETGSYNQIAIGAGGELYFPLKQSVGISYGIQLLDDCWQLEMKIPFSALMIPVEKKYSKNWTINVCRANNGKNATEYSSWASLDKGIFHDPGNFMVIRNLNVNLAELAKKQQDAKTGPFEVFADQKIFSDTKIITLKSFVKTDHSLKKHSIRYSFSDRNGIPILNKTEKPVFFSNELKIPASQLPEGKITLRAELISPDGKKLHNSSYTFWMVPPKKNKKIDRYRIVNHNTYKNGEFFFPILTWGGGIDFKMYNDSRMNRKEFMHRYSERLKELRHLGFNAIIPDDVLFREVGEYVSTHPELRKRFSDWLFQKYMPLTLKEHSEFCKQHGIALVPYPRFLHVNPTTDDAIELWIHFLTQYRELDNILAWHTSDERDAAVEKNKLEHQLYKQIDPERLTWINVINGVGPNKDSADILSSDPYPVPTQSVAMVGGHGDRLNNVLADRPEQGIWLWIQLFGGEGGWTRSPSAEELRSMVFISMNHGVRGLAYFVYKSPEFRNGVMTSDQRAYDMLAVTNKQVGELARMFCLGKRVYLKNNPKNIDLAVIEYDGDVYVSAVNTTKNTLTDFKIKVSRNGTYRVLYEDRVLNAEHGVLCDTFKPFEVHIYKIDRPVKKEK